MDRGNKVGRQQVRAFRMDLSSPSQWNTTIPGSHCATKKQISARGLPLSGGVKVGYLEPYISDLYPT